MSYHDDDPDDVPPTAAATQNAWEEEESDGPEPSIVSEGGLHYQSPTPTETDFEASRPIFPIPVWLSEQSKSFHFAWIPLPIRRTARWINDWTKGPDEAQIQRIRPWFPVVQEAPLWAIKTFLPQFWQKAVALGLLLGAWLLIFSLILDAQQSSGKIEGYGYPVPIWCGANYWSDGNGCGIDGNNCRPFANSSMPFKCNANCMGVKRLQPYTVGDQEIQYTQLVVGGSDASGEFSFYRADSFICQAAIHAGVINEDKGGCGVVELSGAQDSFVGNTRNKLTSLSFDSSFPKSYTFRKDVSADCGSVDRRWELLGVTVTFTTLISVFVSSPSIFFSCNFAMLFVHVSLVSDRPNISDMPTLLSLMVGRFLPGSFVAAILFLVAIRPQLERLTAQIEKTILWLGAAWVGALSNYTFNWIPVSRLTPRDLTQPGALLSVILIGLGIFFIALGQVYYLRLEKRLRTYLVIYGCMGTFLIICVLIPQLSLRIHHYVLALLLVPGTRTQTRPALVYQGLLMGLFINGIARWGFDPILQTSFELFHGGDVRSLLPTVNVSGVSPQNITFDWAVPPEPYDGVSVLVNDVERRRWYVGEGSPCMTWERLWDELRQKGEKVYFRFAYMEGSAAQDYTKAGVWETNGNWTHMRPGTSNAKRYMGS